MTTRTTTRLSIALFIGAIAFVAFAATGCAAKDGVQTPSASAKSAPLPGVYTVTGENFQGDTYAGVLEVEAHDNGVVSFLWVFGKGSITQEWISAYGYGFMQSPTQVVLVLVVNAELDGLTVAEYSLRGDGTWKGKYSPTGSGVVGVETLTPSKRTFQELIEELPPIKQVHPAIDVDDDVRIL